MTQVTERDNITGLFVRKDCGDLRCNGNHSFHGKSDTWCPAARERHNAQRRVRREAGDYNGLERENEVLVPQGFCVAWECNEPAEGLACAAHKGEFEDRDGARTGYLTDEDRAHREHMTHEEWEAFRKRQSRIRKRELNPDYLPGEDPLAFACRMAGEAAQAKAKAVRDERREIVLRELEVHGFVTSKDLIDYFKASATTVKVLLEGMEEDGLLERIYGGARAPGTDIRIGKAA